MCTQALAGGLVVKIFFIGSGPKVLISYIISSYSWGSGVEFLFCIYKKKILLFRDHAWGSGIEIYGDPEPNYYMY